MELLLELRYGAGGSANCADVRVDVDPEDTVAALTGALSDYLRRTGHSPNLAGVGLFRPGGALPLEPAARVVDTGLVSGETVVLAEVRRRPEGSPTGHN